MKIFKQSTVFALLFFLVSFSACKKEANNENTILPEKEYIDVAYGSDELQKMDVYLPQGRTDKSTKVIVMIHGGAWFEGDKSDFTDAIQAFKFQLTDWA